MTNDQMREAFVAWVNSTDDDSRWAAWQAAVVYGMRGRATTGSAIMGDNKIAQRLQDCADDPMWANYAEVSQELLRAAAQYIRELEQDAALLDAGCIMTHERNDFGEEYRCERRGLDLRASIRAAIDAARKEKGHG